MKLAHNPHHDRLEVTHSYFKMKREAWDHLQTTQLYQETRQCHPDPDHLYRGKPSDDGQNIWIYWEPAAQLNKGYWGNAWYKLANFEFVRTELEVQEPVAPVFNQHYPYRSSANSNLADRLMGYPFELIEMIIGTLSSEQIRAIECELSRLSLINKQRRRYPF